MKKDSSLTFPSLNILRTFTAVGTHLNLSRAAEERLATPSAVGHQIRELETTRHTPLFLRVGKRLELTDAKQMLLPDLRVGLPKLRRQSTLSH